MGLVPAASNPSETQSMGLLHCESGICCVQVSVCKCNTKPWTLYWYTMGLVHFCIHVLLVRNGSGTLLYVVQVHSGSGTLLYVVQVHNGSGTLLYVVLVHNGSGTFFYVHVSRV